MNRSELEGLSRNDLIILATRLQSSFNDMQVVLKDLEAEGESLSEEKKNLTKQLTLLTDSTQTFCRDDGIIGRSLKQWGYFETVNAIRESLIDASKTDENFNPPWSKILTAATGSTKQQSRAKAGVVSDHIKNKMKRLQEEDEDVNCYYYRDKDNQLLDNIYYRRSDSNEVFNNKNFAATEINTKFQEKNNFNMQFELGQFECDSCSGMAEKGSQSSDVIATDQPQPSLDYKLFNKKCFTNFSEMLHLELQVKDALGLIESQSPLSVYRSEFSTELQSPFECTRKFRNNSNMFPQVECTFGSSYEKKEKINKQEMCNEETVIKIIKSNEPGVDNRDKIKRCESQQSVVKEKIINSDKNDSEIEKAFQLENKEVVINDKCSSLLSSMCEESVLTHSSLSVIEGLCFECYDNEDEVNDLEDEAEISMVSNSLFFKEEKSMGSTTTAQETIINEVYLLTTNNKDQTFKLLGACDESTEKNEDQDNSNNSNCYVPSKDNNYLVINEDNLNVNLLGKNTDSDILVVEENNVEGFQSNESIDDLVQTTVNPEEGRGISEKSFYLGKEGISDSHSEIVTESTLMVNQQVAPLSLNTEERTCFDYDLCNESDYCNIHPSEQTHSKQMQRPGSFDSIFSQKEGKKNNDKGINESLLGRQKTSGIEIPNVLTGCCSVARVVGSSVFIKENVHLNDQLTGVIDGHNNEFLSSQTDKDEDNEKFKFSGKTEEEACDLSRKKDDEADTVVYYMVINENQFTLKFKNGKTMYMDWKHYFKSIRMRNNNRMELKNKNAPNIISLEVCLSFDKDEFVKDFYHVFTNVNNIRDTENNNETTFCVTVYLALILRVKLTSNFVCLHHSGPVVMKKEELVYPIHISSSDKINHSFEADNGASIGTFHLLVYGHPNYVEDCSRRKTPDCCENNNLHLLEKRRKFIFLQTEGDSTLFALFRKCCRLPLFSISNKQKYFGLIDDDKESFSFDDWWKALVSCDYTNIYSLEELFYLKARKNLDVSKCQQAITLNLQECIEEECGKEFQQKTDCLKSKASLSRSSTDCLVSGKSIVDLLGKQLMESDNLMNKTEVVSMQIPVKYSFSPRLCTIQENQSLDEEQQTINTQLLQSLANKPSSNEKKKTKKKRLPPKSIDLTTRMIQVNELEKKLRKELTNDTQLNEKQVKDKQLHDKKYDQQAKDKKLIPRIGSHREHVEDRIKKTETFYDFVCILRIQIDDKAFKELRFNSRSNLGLKCSRFMEQNKLNAVYTSALENTANKLKNDIILGRSRIIPIKHQKCKVPIYVDTIDIVDIIVSS